MMCITYRSDCAAVIYIDNNIVLSAKQVSPEMDHIDCTITMEDFVKKYGYRSCGDLFETATLLRSFHGRPFSELETELHRRVKRNERHREWLQERAKRASETAKLFNSCVLGVDKKTVEVFDYGFNVEVALNPLKTTEELVKAIRSKEFLPFVVENLQQIKKMRPIVAFCRVSKIAISNQRSFALVTFEIADELMGDLTK